MTSDRDYINGFTLIELLVVVGIIGILVAIALPQFASYNARGFDSRAKSDLRNVATAQEHTLSTTRRFVRVAMRVVSLHLIAF